MSDSRIPPRPVSPVNHWMTRAEFRAMSGLAEGTVVNYFKKLKKHNSGNSYVLAHEALDLLTDKVMNNIGNSATKDKSAEGSEMQSARDLKLEAEADIHEIKLRIMKKELILREDLETYITNILAIFKRNIMSLGRILYMDNYASSKKDIRKSLNKRLTVIVEEHDYTIKEFIKYIKHMEKDMKNAK